jgi:hypothetical protein
MYVFKRIAQTKKLKYSEGKFRKKNIILLLFSIFDDFKQLHLPTIKFITKQQ